MFACGGGDLRAMGDDKYLLVRACVGQLGQSFANRRRGGPTDAGVDLIEDNSVGPRRSGEHDFQSQHEAAEFPTRSNLAEWSGS